MTSPTTSRLIFVDVETTGLNPSRERITEIAFVESDGTRILREEATLLNPECRIPDMIASLTGITNEMVENAPRFCEKAKWILDNLKDAIVVGHNVRFDHGFLSAEFAKLGFPLRLNTACTVRLAKHYSPSKLASYSLGKLCAHFGISLTGAHRALADARASAELFHKLYALSGMSDIKSFLNFSQSNLRLPPDLPKSDIDKLPEKAGVYYFHSDTGAVLYVGKAINIRSRVLSHFSNDLRDLKERKLKEQVRSITYEETGSELLALLHESDTIKKLKPIFNRAQRRERNLFGIYRVSNASNDGMAAYHELRLMSLADEESALQPGHAGEQSQWQLLKSFASKRSAINFLQELCKEEALCTHFVSESKKPPLGNKHSRRAQHTNAQRPCFARQLERCQGACIGEEAPKSYNERLEKVVGKISGTLPNLHDALILEKARKPGEWGVVHVRHGVYQGFGFFSGKASSQNVSKILAAIEPKASFADTNKILQSYLTRHQEDPTSSTSSLKRRGLKIIQIDHPSTQQLELGVN